MPGTDSEGPAAPRAKFAKYPTETINIRYVDTRKLIEVLTEIFGKLEFEIELNQDHWYLRAPRSLTPSELDWIRREATPRDASGWIY